MLMGLQQRMQSRLCILLFRKLFYTLSSFSLKLETSFHFVPFFFEFFYLFLISKITVNCNFDHFQRKHRAFQSRRAYSYSKILQDIFPSQIFYLPYILSFDSFCQYRCRGFAYRASVPMKFNIDYLPILVDFELELIFVATKRVHIMKLYVRILDSPVVPRIVVVIQNVFLIHFETHIPKTFLALFRAFTNSSTSSFVLYIKE